MDTHITNEEIEWNYMFKKTLVEMCLDNKKSLSVIVRSMPEILKTNNNTATGA